MKTWQHIALGILIGLILAGGILLFILPNRGSPITLVTKTPDLTPQASATLALIRVHVTGAVNEPGLITLPKDACLADAIEKAGGLIEGYDQNLLNLSEPISDGQRIHIPRLDEQSISNFKSRRSITFDRKKVSSISIPLTLKPYVFCPASALPRHKQSFNIAKKTDYSWISLIFKK